MRPYRQIVADIGAEEILAMVGSSQDEAVSMAAGRVGLLAALVGCVIGLAVMPSVLAAMLLIAGPIAGPGPSSALAQVLQSLNVLRLGTGAGLLLTLPLLRGEQ